MWMFFGVLALATIIYGLSWVICKTLEAHAGRPYHQRLDAPERWEAFRAGLRSRAPFELASRKGYFLHRCYLDG